MAFMKGRKDCRENQRTISKIKGRNIAEWYYRQQTTGKNEKPYKHNKVRKNNIIKGIKMKSVQLQKENNGVMLRRSTE